VKKIIIIILISSSFSFAKESSISISLNNAISMAMKNSNSLAGLRTTEKVSRQLVKESWRNYIPDISLSYGNNQSVSIMENDTRNQSLNLSMSYNLYTNGKTITQTKLVKLESLLSSTNYLLERNKIHLTVTSKFYGIMKAKEEIKINKKLLESLFFQKRIIVAQKRLGMATELQRVQVEARIKEAQYKIIAAKNNLKTQEKDLQVLCGLNYKISIKIKGTMPKRIVYILPKKITLISIALKNRPEVKKSQFTLLKAKQQLRLATYYYLPEITISGSCGLSGPKLPGEITWSLGLTLSTNFFGNTISGGQTFGESGGGNTRSSNTSVNGSIMDKHGFKSAILQAKGAYSQALYESKNMKNAIALEVTQAWNSLKETEKMVQLALDNQSMVTKQVMIEKAKARLGQITKKDLFESLIQLSQAELRYNSSRIDQLIAIAKLENALGYKIGSLMKKEVK